MSKTAHLQREKEYVCSSRNSWMTSAAVGGIRGRGNVCDITNREPIASQSCQDPRWIDHVHLGYLFYDVVENWLSLSIKERCIQPHPVSLDDIGSFDLHY